MCRRSDRTARPPFLNDQGQSVGFALVCLAKESGISENICLVTDVGPGSGRAIADRFAGGGYKVAMLARDLDQLNEISAQTDNAFAYACDVRTVCHGVDYSEDLGACLVSHTQCCRRSLRKFSGS